MVSIPGLSSRLVYCVLILICCFTYNVQLLPIKSDVYGHIYVRANELKMLFPLVLRDLTASGYDFDLLKNSF